MSTAARRCALLLAAASVLSVGCEDYATTERVQHVAEEVTAVRAQQTTLATELKREITRTESRMDIVVERQDETQRTLSAMGDGFNELAQAVDTAHRKTDKVAKRQRRLEDTVARRLPPRSPEPPAEQGPVQLIGRGEDLRDGRLLPTLTLILEEPPTLVSQTTRAAQPLTYTVRRIGRRLYGLPPFDTDDDLICLDILTADARLGDGFRAARCREPAHLYAFATT